MTTIEMARRPESVLLLSEEHLSSITDRVRDYEEELDALDVLFNGPTADKLMKADVVPVIAAGRQKAEIMKSFVSELADGFDVTIRPITSGSDTNFGQVTDVGIFSERLDELMLGVEEFMELLQLDLVLVSQVETKRYMRDDLQAGRSLVFKLNVSK